MITGDWVLVDKKIKAQFIHFEKEGFATVDVCGIWNIYGVNRIEKI